MAISIVLHGGIYELNAGIFRTSWYEILNRNYKRIFD